MLRNIKIYVISLAESNRRNLTQYYLGELRGSFEYFDAFNAMQRETEVKELCSMKAMNLRYGRKIGVAECGCALSHRQVIDAFYATNAEFAFIMEDDCRLKADTIQHIEQLCNSNLKFDMVSFFSGTAIVSKRDLYTINHTNYYRVVGRLDHAVGYLISRSGAEKYLSNVKYPLQALADWPIDMLSWRAYVSSTNLVEHVNINSSIDSTRANRISIYNLSYAAIVNAIKNHTLLPLKELCLSHLIPSLARRGLYPERLTISHEDSSI